MASDSPHRKIRSSRKYRDFRARMLRQLGDRCHICHHPDAHDLDHIIASSERPDLMLDPTNVMPAHGVEGCPHCPPIVTKNGSRRPACNQIRQTGQSAAPGSSRRPDTGAMSIAELEEFYKVGPGGSVTRVRDGLMIRREW